MFFILEKGIPFLFQVHGALRQILQDHNPEEAEVLTLAAHCTPKPGTGRHRCVQPVNMVSACALLSFWKGRCSPGWAEHLCFPSWVSSYIRVLDFTGALSSDSSLTLAIWSHPWAVQLCPSPPPPTPHTSYGPGSSPALVLSTALCSTAPMVTGFLLLLTPPFCLELGAPFPCLTNTS